mgnify:CR=1 FL=1
MTEQSEMHDKPRESEDRIHNDQAGVSNDESQMAHSNQLLLGTRDIAHPPGSQLLQPSALPAHNLSPWQPDLLPRQPPTTQFPPMPGIPGTVETSIPVGGLPFGQYLPGLPPFPAPAAHTSIPMDSPDLKDLQMLSELENNLKLNHT